MGFLKSNGGFCVFPDQTRCLKFGVNFSRFGTNFSLGLDTIWTCQQKLFIFLRNCLTVSDLLCSKKYIFLVHCPRCQFVQSRCFEFNPKKENSVFDDETFLRFYSHLNFVDCPFCFCFLRLIFSNCPYSDSKAHAGY